MQFSPYIVLQKQDETLDPLGFLQPLGPVKDAVFPQFTTLTRHPGYLSFLCFAFDFWERRGVAVQDKDFLRKVRLLEVLWGLLHAQEGQSVLNITKYTTLLNMKRLSRVAFDADPGNLFKRLNYGAYGHYVVPCVTWGLVTKPRSGLTQLGRRLATAWGKRSGTRFEELAEAWLKGPVSTDDKTLREAGKAFLLNAEPDQSERDVLQEAMTNFSVDFPVLAQLWQGAIPSRIQQLEPRDTRLLSTAVAEYSSHAELALRLQRCLVFDLLAGIIRFVFDLEYLRLTDALPELPEKELTAKVQERLESLIIEYEQLCRELTGPRWDLPDTLRDLPSFTALTAAVLEHHVRHQRRKGACPYMENGQICMLKRVDARNLAAALEAFQASERLSTPVSVDTALLVGYGRNWYFEQLIRWRQYAGSIEAHA